ncbi:hypothetical protein EV284_6446 [Streptomyces sp. BK022]|uniref:hypothetical protein n=1 Tax=Streptomyces sp. BK022 TaxID=2512123 RepID=UPI00102A1BE3|nr:hypothetical protein [Streptomyces sp. BK022]RZU28280.1 hypothetical protein EV284_6446 [Streptomyces sp. BK022]
MAEAQTLAERTRKSVLAAFGLVEDDPLGQALDSLYLAARADREAGEARVLGDLQAVEHEVTESLLPPALRAPGIHFAYCREA